ncbi:hypothetical protein [Streptomyces sp. NRRL F-5122]|uniref:hypothetical protein n=1 Tax=Streptomyces sp. NRRL F-5122 TaxID=1609098 RepID=UPI00131B18D0|nr:hypothetical protein [Streptomyces sp. NRRL F-5122]
MYLPEQDLLPPLDRWLALAFAPHRLEETISLMHTAQSDTAPAPSAKDVSRVVADCDTKLARYRDALEAGADPKVVAGWIAEVQARRAEAAA